MFFQHLLFLSDVLKCQFRMMAWLSVSNAGSNQPQLFHQMPAFSSVFKRLPAFSSVFKRLPASSSGIMHQHQMPVSDTGFSCQHL